MFHLSGHGFTPDVPTQICESTQIDQHTHTTYVDDYDPPKKSKKSWVEEEVQDNKSREEEVKDNTHVQKVSKRTSARILKGKQNISDSTHDLKQQQKRGAIFIEDEAVVKDQIPLNKKKKIVAEVKPQEAVPDEKDHVGDSELQNSPMFPESDEEDEDDFLDDIMPMTNKCNLDIVHKELQKELKFKNVNKWLKEIKGDVILPTLEPVVQAIVPGFVSTEAEVKLGAVSKLPEFVPPENMGNFGAGTRLPGFVPPESMGNIGEGTRLPGFVRPESMGNVGAGSKLPEFVPTQTGIFWSGCQATWIWFHIQIEFQFTRYSEGTQSGVLSCKVIRVDTRTTNYKQSPTTINIDRPAYIKTDKQCRTHTTSTARLPDD